MAETKIVRQMVKYSFFKVRPEWRRLPSVEREQDRSEFRAAVEEVRESVMLRTYSTMGIRGDTDFLFWMVHEDPKRISGAHARINRTRLAGYLDTPHSYHAQMCRSMYVDKHEHPGSESSRSEIIRRDAPYFFVYPFVKSRPWYALTQEERQKAMSQHMEFGHRFPAVTINTGYSFGIDDQEWVVAFESDNVQDFLDLVMEMRHTKASAFTLRDTPAFTCIAASIEEILAELG